MTKDKEGSIVVHLVNVRDNHKFPEMENYFLLVRYERNDVLPDRFRKPGCLCLAGVFVLYSFGRISVQRRGFSCPSLSS